MKLLNLSYDDLERREEAERIAGARYGFIESMRRGGTGSPKAELVAATPEVEQWMHETVDRSLCNIEMRSHGAIVRFRIRQEVMALVLERGEVQRIETKFEPGVGLNMRWFLASQEVFELRATVFNTTGWRSFLRRNWSSVLHEF